MNNNMGQLEQERLWRACESAYSKSLCDGKVRWVTRDRRSRTRWAVLNSPPRKGRAIFVGSEAAGDWLPNSSMGTPSPAFLNELRLRVPTPKVVA